MHRPERRFAGDSNGFSEVVAFTASGNTLISASPYTHEIRSWRTSDGTLQQLYDEATAWGPSIALPLAVSTSGAWLAIGLGGADLELAHEPLP